MVGYERRSYIVAWLSLIVASISLVMGCWAIRASWEIAGDSGSLDKAAIEVGIGAYPLASGRENFIVLGAPKSSSQQKPVVGVIPFSFRSTGQRSLDSLAISFQYDDKIFNRSLLEEATSTTQSGGFAAESLNKSVSQEAERFFVLYSTASLNPGISLKISEPVFIEDTRIQDAIPAEFKNGAKAILPVAINYAKQFGIAVSARDTQILGYPMTIAMQVANSMDELTHSSDLSIYIESKQNELRSRLGFGSYLAALLTSSPTGNIYLVYVPLKDVTSGHAVVYAPSKDPEVAKATFPLLSWRLLF